MRLSYGAENQSKGMFAFNFLSVASYTHTPHTFTMFSLKDAKYTYLGYGAIYLVSIYTTTLVLNE